MHLTSKSRECSRLIHTFRVEDLNGEAKVIGSHIGDNDIKILCLEGAVVVLLFSRRRRLIGRFVVVRPDLHSSVRLRHWRILERRLTLSLAFLASSCRGGHKIMVYDFQPGTYLCIKQLARE